MHSLQVPSCIILALFEAQRVVQIVAFFIILVHSWKTFQNLNSFNKGVNQTVEKDPKNLKLYANVLHDKNIFKRTNSWKKCHSAV